MRKFTPLISSKVDWAEKQGTDEKTSGCGPENHLCERYMCPSPAQAWACFLGKPALGKRMKKGGAESPQVLVKM